MPHPYHKRMLREQSHIQRKKLEQRLVVQLDEKFPNIVGMGIEYLAATFINETGRHITDK